MYKYLLSNSEPIKCNYLIASRKRQPHSIIPKTAFNPEPAPPKPPRTDRPVSMEQVCCTPLDLF